MALLGPCGKLGRELEISPGIRAKRGRDGTRKRLLQFGKQFHRLAIKGIRQRACINFEQCVRGIFAKL